MYEVPADIAIAERITPRIPAGRRGLLVLESRSDLKVRRRSLLCAHCSGLRCVPFECRWWPR